MRRSIRRLLAIIAVTAAALVAGHALTPAHPALTSARFTDAEVAAASYTTTTLQQPYFDSCSNSAGNITVVWHFTNSNVPGVTASNVQWAANNGLVTSLTGVLTPGQTSTTGPNSSGQYSTTISSGVLGSVVSLNGFTIQAQTAYQSWTALGPRAANGVSTGLVGIGVYTCNVS